VFDSSTLNEIQTKISNINTDFVKIHQSDLIVVSKSFAIIYINVDTSTNPKSLKIVQNLNKHTKRILDLLFNDVFNHQLSFDVGG
jgi:hypothetical protein